MSVNFTRKLVKGVLTMTRQYSDPSITCRAGHVSYHVSL